MTKPNEPTTEEMLEMIDWAKLKVATIDEFPICDAIRTLISRQPAGDALVKWSGELRIDIGDIGESLASGFIWENFCAAIDAYEKAGEPK